MQISGQWLLCDDGIIRPIIRGAVLAADGSWQEAEFLVDPAADRTVFNALILAALELRPFGTSHQLAGVGGRTAAVLLETRIRLTREQGSEVVFRGCFAAVTELGALDIRVLGRDITNLFAMIVDRPGDVVCLLGQRHRYRIVYS